MKFLTLVVLPAALVFAVCTAARAAGTTRPAFASQPVEKDGLQVTLVGDKAVFARNEPIQFTVRFKNVSDKPLSLFDADDFSNWLIRLDGVAGAMPWRLQGTAADPPAEPPRPPRELQPGESGEVTTRWGSNRFPFQYVSELVLNMPIPPADTLSPGRYRLWVGITLKKDREADAARLALRGDINVGPVEVEVTDKDGPQGIQASEAVTENGADFQTVTRTRWAVPAAAGAESEVLLGLKVTNRGGRWMQVNAFDTARVVLEDSGGNELKCVRARDATKVPEPLLLQAREGRTLYRNAILQWSADGKRLRLSGPDGAGGDWHFDDVRPGKYKVRFVFENNEETLKPVLDRPAKHAIDPKEAPFWMGKAKTRELAVEVVVEAPAAPDGRSLGVQCRKADDAVQVGTEGGTTVLNVTSRSGIGGATIERRGEHWPDVMVLRIYLRGLESLSIAGGDTTLLLAWGTTTHGGGGSVRLLRRNDVERDERRLAKDDPCWTEVRALDAKGKPVDGLPGEGGWFELAIPKALLTDQNKTLALEWIDFYRN